MSRRPTSTDTVSRRASVPTLWMLWRLMRFAGWRYPVNLVLWASIWVMPVIPGLLTRAFFDRLETSAGLNVTTIVALLSAYSLGRITVMVVGMINDAHLSFRVGSLLRRNMLARIFQLPGSRAVQESPGETISRFREDVEHVEEALSWTVDIAGSILFASVASVIMVSIDARITALVFTPLVLIVLVAERFGTRLRRYRTAAREATGRITGAMGELFGSVQAVKVAGAEGTMVGHLSELNDERRKLEVRDRVLTAGLESVFWNTISIGTGLVLILSAQRMGGGGEGLSVGDFALFVYFLGFLTDAVYFVGIFIARIKQAGVSLERMVELLQGGTPAMLVAGADLGLTGDLPEPEPPVWSDADRLERLDVAGLTFHYPGTDRGIDGVDLHVERGSFVVITGRIGAGKSTLLRVLLGLLPADAGSIRWNGEEVADPDDFFVPPRAAYTGQVPTLFSMTLRENLLLGVADVPGALPSAIRAAALEHDVDAMSDGLESMVGPLGVRLSGGQVQRSAAARMFVRRPELLVFDDLSSALDVETEKVLWERLFAAHADATALVVSHRRPALQRADQIIVMSHGRVEARGTLQELMASSPEFRRLWAGDFDAE
jgi:ATP-binding cassette, subfamily B, bacterial